jgi:tRNA isopentenyl-2-thiomethyl-A-37 hydroxylase MiaE
MTHTPNAYVTHLESLLKAAQDAMAIYGKRNSDAIVYAQKLIADYPVIMGKELSHVIQILEGTKP